MTGNNFFEKAAAGLAQNGNIQEKYIKLYAKAMEVVLAMGINLLTALLIGYLCGMLRQCVLFLIAFIPLRSYAGGYHARGYISCYLESCALLTAALLLIRYLGTQRTITTAFWQVFVISAIVVFTFAPLADANKPISEKETVIFRKRARLILCAEVLITVIFTCLRVDWSYPVMMAVAVSAFALVLHKCKEYLKTSRKQVGD